LTALRWPPVIASSGFTLAMILATGINGPARVVAALWFLLVCTGMSFAPLLDVTVGERLLVGLLLSLAIDAVVATAIVEIGDLSVVSGLLALEAVCAAGCLWQVRGARRVR
jgi:hypothetical protein